MSQGKKSYNTPTQNVVQGEKFVWYFAKMWFFGCFIQLRGLISKNFTTQKSLRIIFFGILHPQNCKNLIFCNFLELSHIFGQWSKDQKLNFLQFLGYRIPKNIILRLFCVVKFFDISPLSSIKHPKNHIFAK